MSEVTAPIMTDATGQSIDSKLNSLLGKMDDLAAAFQPNASDIVYSNTTSGLTGDDVQEAIDEMAADVTEIKSSLSQLPYELITVSGSSTNFDRFELYSNSQFVYINFQTKNATFNENDVLVNLPSSCRPTNTQMLLGWCYALDKAYMLQLKSNGDLCAYGKGTITGRIIGSVLACII